LALTRACGFESHPGHKTIQKQKIRK